MSATPVNNRVRDLQNQLALAYEGNDDDWTKKLGLTTDIDTVFRNAQKAYGAWSKLDPEERTTKNLMDRLDFDFFKYGAWTHMRARAPYRCAWPRTQAA